MSLSSSTLSVIQKAGAAAFAADVNLKNAVKEYADRLNAAMQANPDGLENNLLFENWKIVSRLSQSVSGIEVELKKLFLVASAIGIDDQPTSSHLMTSAVSNSTGKKVARSQNLALNARLNVKEEVATKSEVQVKSKAKISRKTKAIVQPLNVAGPADRPLVLGANPTKVLRHLESILNTNDFTVISQTEVSKVTGIPLGSMTAATKKLLELGLLIAGPSGSFKLADAKLMAAL
jgi:hypothetical protein